MLKLGVIHFKGFQFQAGWAKWVSFTMEAERFRYSPMRVYCLALCGEVRIGK